MRLLLLAAGLSVVMGSPQFPPAMSPAPGQPLYQPPGGGGQGVGQCGLQVDECCGMASEGCCVGGQECYTYYETVCDSAKTQRCRPKFKQVCVQETLPYCSVQKKRGSVNIREEVCQLKSKRECFDWKRKVCDLRPASVTAEINWTNEKLVPKRNGSETRQKCETVSKCKYEDIEKVVTERVPVQNCEDIQDTQQQCKNVPTAVPRVVEQISYEVRYISECSVVSQPRCESSPCQSNGCANGGSVCSTSEFQPQTVCAEGQVTGESSNCQQVDMPVCYGQLNTCQQLDQQCCYNQPQQVCRQVPQRYPVKRNVTVQEYKWEKQCDDITVTRKECKTDYEVRNRTVTTQKCNSYLDNVCANYTVPQYEVQVEEKRENVSFVSRKCKFREVSEQYCQTFPNADYICRNSRPATRQYILNKVTCREQKTVQFCMNIPEGECEDVPDQKCRVVPRQVCQDKCSTSNMCNQCDSFRNQGGFSCSSGNCANYFPEDPTISGDFGTGFNPGNIGGESGFNPGNMGGSGFNPGNIGDNSGYNPGLGGESGYNPGLGGESGYNPGYGYGDLVTVGDNMSPDTEEWSPGDDWYSPGDRAKPLWQNFVRDGYVPLGQPGQSGYNPGYDQSVPLDPSNGWNTGNGQSGFNPGGFSGLSDYVDDEIGKVEGFEEELESDSLTL